MSDNRPTRETVSLEEATLSNMWEIAAIVEVLEQKRLCTKHDLLDADREVHRRLTEGSRQPRVPPTATGGTTLTAQDKVAKLQLLLTVTVAGACSHTSPVFLSNTAPVKTVVNREADGLLVSHRRVWLPAWSPLLSLARICSSLFTIWVRMLSVAEAGVTQLPTLAITSPPPTSTAPIPLTHLLFMIPLPCVML